MFSKIALALVLVTVAVQADKPSRSGGYAYSQPQESESVEHEPQPFDFGYIVQAENSAEASQGHSSSSDGSTVTGQYRVELPDCRTQVVTYSAHPVTGFSADVTYEGEICEYVPPSKEDSYESPRSAYNPPRNSYSAPN